MASDSETALIPPQKGTGLRMRERSRGVKWLRARRVLVFWMAGVAVVTGVLLHVPDSLKVDANT